MLALSILNEAHPAAASATAGTLKLGDNGLNR